MTKGRILIVDDDPHAVEILTRMLEREGYECRSALRGAAALDLLAEEAADAILLDVMMPEMDGFALCQAIRLDNEKVPILFLTAKSASGDRVAGLKLGADDYLTKPFNLEELLLRVQNLLKRSSSSQETVSSLSTCQIEGNLINFPEMTVTTPDGRKINLTKKENTLLKLLLDRKNEVVSREHILETVWGYDIYPSTRTIDNFIVTFRKYFEKDPSHPVHFQSVRGVGYKYCE